MERQQLNITMGTDVVLHDVLIFDDETFDPSLSTGIEANLVNSLGKRTSLDVEVVDDYLVIDVPWDDSRNAGCYGLEVKGVCNERKWSTYADALIRYTRATREGQYEVEVQSDYYDITQVVSYRYSNSPIDKVTVDIDGGYGDPTVDSTYDGKNLDIQFHNLKGNGIVSVVQTTTSTEDEGVNVTTITMDNGSTAEMQVRNGGKGTKGDKGDMGDSAVFDPSTGNIATIKQSTGDDTESPMSQKAVTDIVKNGMYASNSGKYVDVNVVIGQRTTAMHDGGITVVQSSQTKRATADLYYPIDMFVCYTRLHVPSGFDVAFFQANTLQYSSSSEAYHTSGWLIPDSAGWVDVANLDSQYPYVCLNYRKSDNTDFTDAQLATLDVGTYLELPLGVSAEDFDGNEIQMVTAVKQDEPMEYLPINILKGKVFNVGRGAIASNTVDTRATLNAVYPYSTFLKFSKLVVPVGYGFSVCSVRNLGDGTTTGVNTELDYAVDGWHDSDGTTYNIGKSIIPAFPYVGINFRKGNDETITDADIEALSNGVRIFSPAASVSFKKIAVVDIDGDTLAGIESGSGEGAYEVMDKESVCVLTGHVGDNAYKGERIDIRESIHTFRRSLYKSLPSAVFAQSFAVYGDYMLRFMYSGTKLYAYLYNLATNTYISRITLSYGSMAIPHCNTAVFGRVFADGNTDLPLLYLSQWNGERGCLVYDIHLDGTANLVQTITPNVSAAKFGEGQADWVVDYDNGFIYSIAYKITDGYYTPESSGNRQMICKFRLPKLGDGAAIVLTDADLVDAYDIPPLNIMQDKCYRNGRIIVAAGGGTYERQEYNKIYSINLGCRRIEAAVDIYGFLAIEPEGLDLYGDMLLMSYNDNSNYGALYAYEF